MRKHHDNRVVPSHLAWMLMLPFTLMAVSAVGQTTSTDALVRTPEVGSSLTAATIADLPLQNAYSLLETTQSEVITDRFNNGGLNVGEDARAGAFLASWSQTSFRIGDADVTDPVRGGGPLLFPELALWETVTTRTGMMGAGVNPPGLAITLTPRRPTAQWTTILYGSGTGGRLASPSPTALSPIARLTEAGQATALISGTLVPNRLGLVAGGSWQHASKFLREVGPSANSHLGSGFAHLVYTSSSGIESRTLAWIQEARFPFSYRQLFAPDAATRDTSVHIQSTLSRRAANGFLWRATGALTDRSRDNNNLGNVSSITADRLFDGPIPSIAMSATGHEHAGRWSAAVHATAPASSVEHHAIKFGAMFDRTFMASSDQFSGRIGELVDTTPARIWIYSHPDADSRRHSANIAAYATDRVTVSPTLTLDAGLRFEAVNGRATGSPNAVSWQSMLPSAVLQWKWGNKLVIGGYRRSANALNLDLLAYGDPNAPTAIVTRFLSAPFAAAAIVDRVGPGTGGASSFSAIDPRMKRPTTDEYVAGIESRLHGWLRVGLTGIARRENNLIGVQDIGVPTTSYSTISIPDPGHDLASTTDDQILIAYNRNPATYAQNQYFVTNSGQPAATMGALKLWADGSTDTLTVLFGATASAANGSAANRGFGPLENDQDSVGELLTDPNASTFARGRLFSDRAFTIKWTMLYKFPKDIRVGAIARYQDGQPFARLVPASDLNQGKELIRAYPNAGNRFTFTGTLDLRIQKRLSIGPQHLDAILDFYNLATRSNEVEEYTVSGPRFRTPTAIEPPRSVQFGARLTF